MPNKAVSQAQYRFFRAVQGGYAKAKGLSPEKAGEMIGHQSPKGLPARSSGRATQRKRQARKGQGY